MGAGKSRKTHSGRKGTKLNKQGVRKIFGARHIDQVWFAWWACVLGRERDPCLAHVPRLVVMSRQVWEDFRKEDAAVHNGAVGPVGTSDK